MVRDPEDGAASQQPEIQQAGPARAPLFERLPQRWRRSAVLGLAFVVGLVAGGAVVWRTQSEPDPAPFQADEHAVELVLFGPMYPRPQPPGQGSDRRALQVDAALLLSGSVASTVESVDTPGGGIDVRAPALPVTVGPSARFRSLRLTIVVEDCQDATRWMPRQRSFVLSWEDEFGREHVDRAGDFDESMGLALRSHLASVCGERN